MITENVLQNAGSVKEVQPLITLPTIMPIVPDALPSTALRLPLSFAESILTAEELEKLEIPERESLVGSWWKEGGYGLIYGQRGNGKTWFSMNMMQCLAEGRDCGPWPIPKPRRVLGVDGEMALGSLRSRAQALRQSITPGLFFLSSQRHLEKTRQGLNLTSPEAQQVLLGECLRLNIEVLFVDNLSCLFQDLRENEADDWEKVLPWLLEMKARGIAVCLVLHAGKDPKTARGTSRREDAADWVMRLETLSHVGESSAKWSAHFVSTFTKDRDCSAEDRGPWQWAFETMADGEPTTVRHSLLGDLEAFMDLVKGGLDSCTDIAKEMDANKSKVTRLAQKARDQKRISIVKEGSYTRYIYIATP